MKPILTKSLAEFIGTFILVFCGTGAIIINQETGGVITHSGIAITFGLVVMALIYAFGDVSGAHFNPAVSVGFWLAKKFPTKDLLPFISSQILGALAASMVLRILFHTNETLGATLPHGSEWQSTVLEFILTFFLMLTVMQVATGDKEKGLMAGIAIGGVVGLEAMFAGPICGASMNPARSIAPALISGHTEHLWIYLAAPLAGAALAIVVWRMLKETTK
ncbi:MAG: aquaporin [Bacteroidetes bacterium]|nr:aquaporin [Bacteroidota bacterium]